MLNSILTGLKTITFWITLIVGGVTVSIVEENINDWYENEIKIISTTDHYITGNYGGAICKDGVYSGSKGQGSCSWHGGIDKYAETSTLISPEIRMEVLNKKYSNKYFWLKFFSVFIIFIALIYGEKIDKIITYEVPSKK